LEITTTEVKFKKYENLEGPTYSLLKSGILILQYENNTREVFSSPDADAQHLTVSIAPTALTNANSVQNLYMQGRTDAARHYKGYTGAGTGTLVTSLLSPLVGLIPAAICSSTEPQESNLNFPDYELMKNADYYNGYTQASKKIKSRKVWTNWGIGLGANLVAIILLSSQ
jgi:hypothetical protein